MKEGQMQDLKDTQLHILVYLIKDKWGDNAVEALAALLSTVVSDDQMQVLIDDLRQETTNV
jgi:hypothetical protein